MPDEFVVDPLDLSFLSNYESVDDGSSSGKISGIYHPLSKAENLHNLKHCLEVDLLGCDGK